MKYVIVSSSHRENSQSSKVARHCENRLKTLVPGAETDIIDLSRNPLPLWDESVWASDPKWSANWFPLRDRLRACDAVVFVVPEWAGMVPAGLKNLLLFCGNLELGHKPGLIMAVSSSMGGAYPVSELRQSGYKNNHVCFIPDHVIVRNVEKVLNNTSKADSPDDERIRIRIDYSLRMLNEYALALKAVRSSPIINFKEFANGM